ncbi:MAG: DNA mismatch repair endonuclease MutL [Planctomycetota bacterium]
MPIRQLPPLLVNQIAAGEVIERPASVVKELVENAIDAAAARIEVAIEGGGKDLIRVSDTGTGIAFDELALAVAPHATSKIETAEDLHAIATMGFRGEALASIASVSRMSILSRPPDEDAAGLVEVEGDTVGEPRPAGGAVGSTVTVRNLFFNTPARRKFLRSEQTEAARVADTIDSLALSHPRLGFGLRVDGRPTRELAGERTPRQRVLDVMGVELAEELHELSAEERGLRLWGLVGTPAIARGTTRHQRVFVNGRPIADRSISHAIKEAYRGLIDPTRYPTVVLFVEMDPAQVDVNVHPTKAEVRFRNQSFVHTIVLTAIRETLARGDLTPAFDLSRTGAPPGGVVPEFGSGMQAGGASGAVGFTGDLGGARPATGREFVEYFRRLDPVQKGFVYSEVKQALAAQTPELLAEAEGASAASSGAEPGAAAPALAIRPVTDVLQVHSTYIVTQDEAGVLIIDQHALHERVLFEKLRAAVTERDLESQRLLMPERVEVEPAQLEALGPLQPLLRRLGIEAEPGGPATVAVHAFTSLLFERKVQAGPFMAELLAKASSQALGPDPEAALSEVLDMMACKAAVKAGDTLSPAELAELVQYRGQVERSSRCPHGRPTTLRLTIADLEKQFGRR